MHRAGENAGMDIGIDVSPIQNGHRFRGIGSYTRGLLYGLGQLETDDRFILYYWKGLPLEIERDNLPRNVTWRGVPFPRVGRVSALLAQQVMMIPSLSMARPDLYHQLGIVADPSAGGLPWAILDRSIVTIHDLTPLVYHDTFLKGKRLREQVYRLMLSAARRARMVLVDSQATQQDVIHLLGVRPERVSIAPLAIAPGLMSALNAHMPSERPDGLPSSYLLTVAGDYPNKDLATLLTAYARIASYPSTPDLVLVGPPGASVARLRQSNDVAAARIHMYTHLSDAQLAAAYRGAVMVIVPSVYEGFGLPVLEAMAAGTPVVAANVSSLPEVAGDAALLVPPRDAVALADAIQELCSCSATRQKLRSRGRERVGLYSWKQTAEATLAAYHRAVLLDPVKHRVVGRPSV